MEDLEEFMKNNKPDGRASKLEPFKQEIMVLKQEGYTEKTILKFLAEVKKVTVSQPALNKFIRKSSSGIVKDNNVIVQNKQDVKAEASRIKKNDNGAEIKPSGAFDWQAPVDPEQYI